jgi:hypothetical protein
MKTVWIAAAALLAVSTITTAVAQNRLPETTIKLPKHVKPSSEPDADLTAQQAQQNFTRDPSVHYQPPSVVRPGDWNAPGVMDTENMTEVQFAQLKALHPTAVFWSRCYTGQDPDPNIRHLMKPYPAWKFCK